MKKAKTIYGSVATLAALISTTVVVAQSAPRPENQIKWRQSAYQVLNWNASRIRASVEGTYKKDEVLRSANTIAAVANSGLDTLFTPGTETGKGWRDTTVKPEFFKNTARVTELNNNFIQEANELAKVAAQGDQAAVKQQFGKLSQACKACHDDFRNTN